MWYLQIKNIVSLLKTKHNLWISIFLIIRWCLSSAFDYFNIHQFKHCSNILFVCKFNSSIRDHPLYNQQVEHHKYDKINAELFYWRTTVQIFGSKMNITTKRVLCRNMKIAVHHIFIDDLDNQLTRSLMCVHSTGTWQLLREQQRLIESIFCRNRMQIYLTEMLKWQLYQFRIALVKFSVISQAFWLLKSSKL